MHWCTTVGAPFKLSQVNQELSCSWKHRLWKKVVKYNAFSQVRSAKKTFTIINIGKRYTLRIPVILKIHVCRILFPQNGFIDWLHGYYLCAFMLRTCTDKMGDPILLPIFAANFAFFVWKQHFLYLIWKEIHKMVNIGSKETWKKGMTSVFLPASIWGHIIGTSSAFVKKKCIGY